jgi:hypothetical protein
MIEQLTAVSKYGRIDSIKKIELTNSMDNQDWKDKINILSN